MSTALSVFLATLIIAVVSYLLGSINFAILVTMARTKKDIRDFGSGNAGMTNVMRTAGKTAGIITFLGDFLKGTISVLIAKYAFVWLASLIGSYSQDSIKSYINTLVIECVAGIFCMLGHIFPIFHEFKGGKGVATVGGVLLVICPPAMLIAITLFIIIVLITKIVSISSIISMVVATILSYIFYNGTGTYEVFGEYQRIAVTALVAVMGIMVIVKHHENIKRLINGTEHKFSLHHEETK